MTQTNDAPSTDPTQSSNDAAGQLSIPATHASSAAQLSQRKITLHGALRNFPDFPIPGIDFVDILPLFADAKLHETLISALELQVLAAFETKPDVIVALDARGFLFGPSLALRLGAGFAPVRKRGKLPGPVETASFLKEYGEDFFQIQKDAVKPGQKVLIVDDIIATGKRLPTNFSEVLFVLRNLLHPNHFSNKYIFTGGSAQAAGTLVANLGADLLGYLFILELDFLKGRDKLNAPVQTLLTDSDKGQS